MFLYRERLNNQPFDFHSFFEKIFVSDKATQAAKCCIFVDQIINTNQQRSVLLLTYGQVSMVDQMSY